MRSSVVPQTIASETAANTNWKKNFASGVTLEKPMMPKVFVASP